NDNHVSHDDIFLSRAGVTTRCRELVGGVDEADGLEEEIEGDLEGFWAELVEGVLRGVMIAVGELVVVGAVIDVDEVEDGDAALFEGDVVVAEARNGIL